MTRRIAGITLGMLLCGFGGAAALGAQSGGAPHTAQPERPTVATHAGTVAPGWFELESGVERDRVGPGINALTTPTLLKLGVASHLQVDLFIGLVRPASPQPVGLGDLSTGVKWRLLDQAPLVGDFAVQPTIKLPTGSASRGTGTGTTDGTLLLISSHVLGPVALDLNLGYTRRSARGDSASAMLWTVSTGTTVAGPLAFDAELYGYPGFGARPAVGLLMGPTYTVHPWFVADIGCIAHVAGGQPPALYAGLTWNVGELW